jgi:hypothetical protein
MSNVQYGFHQYSIFRESEIVILHVFSLSHVSTICGYRLGIISLVHALVHVTDLPVVNVHVDELSSTRIWQHKLCAILSASLDINYLLLLYMPSFFNTILMTGHSVWTEYCFILQYISNFKYHNLL